MVSIAGEGLKNYCLFYALMGFARISLKSCLQHRLDPWLKGTHVCLNEGSRLFPRGDNNNEIAKIH